MAPAAEAADQEGIGDTDHTEHAVRLVTVKCCLSSPLGGWGARAEMLV